MTRPGPARHTINASGIAIPVRARRCRDVGKNTKSRFTVDAALEIRAVELPGEVESEIETVREAGSRELPERRPLAVIEIELKHVAACLLLQGEAVGRFAWAVAAGAGDHLADEVHRVAHADAPAEAHHHRVALDVQQRGRVVNPDRGGVELSLIHISEPTR